MSENSTYLYWGTEVGLSKPCYAPIVDFLFKLLYGASSSKNDELSLTPIKMKCLEGSTKDSKLFHDKEGGETNARTIIGEVFQKGAYNHLLSHLKSQKKESFHIVDAGANIGSFSIFMGSKIENCTIYAMEVVDKTRQVLINNLEKCAIIKPSSNVYIVPMGLIGGKNPETAPSTLSFYHFVCQPSNSTSMDTVKLKHDSMMKALMDPTKKLFSHRFGSSWPVLTTFNSLLPFSFMRGMVQRTYVAYLYRYKKVEVKLGSIEDVISNTPSSMPPAIDLVKIDTEGMELANLMAISKDTWSRIQTLAVEIHDTRKDELLNAEKKLKSEGLENVWHLPDFEYNKRGANKHLLTASRLTFSKEVEDEMIDEGFTKL